MEHVLNPTPYPGVMADKDFLVLCQDFRQELKNLIQDGRGAVAHDTYHKLARAIFLHQNNGQKTHQPSELRRKGYEVFPQIISQEDVKKLRSLLDNHLFQRSTDEEARISQAYSQTFGGENTLRHAQIPAFEKKAVMQIVHKILSSDLGTKTTGLFESHFSLSRYMLNRVLPTTQPSGSFRWHRDLAPLAQLHIMIYLTDTGENGEGGQTEFLNRTATRELENVGYSFPKWTERVNHIDEISGGQLYASEVVRPHLRPGDAIAFQACQVLHKGVAPQKDPRDTLTIILLPSLNPWTRMIDYYGDDVFLQRFESHHSLGHNPDEP
jgi:hypothetical protein